jgi:hypothetical protein
MANTIDVSLVSLCDQRQKQMKYNIPPPRYVPINPYLLNNGEFTQSQLDMRRKAEILKYNNNASSSKTNNITKKQQYANIITSRTQSGSNLTIVRIMCMFRLNNK